MGGASTKRTLRSNPLPLVFAAVFMGCHATLSPKGERCVTSEKKAARETPPPGVDAAMKHKKCEITAFRIEAYLRAKNVQTFQRVRLAKLPL